jgi:hypothetical protein
MTWAANRIERAPSQAPPQTRREVERCTDRNKLGEGVNRLGLIGSRVIVDRTVGVKVGKGVSATRGVSVKGVVVGANVLSTNRSGVFVASRE